MRQGKNLEICKSVFMYFGTDPREKRDDRRRGDSREEYLRGHGFRAQTEDLGSAKNRDTPFIVSGGKKAHLNA